MFPNKILDYYLDSNYYFKTYLSMFLDDRKGQCSCKGKRYSYKSYIYLEWEKREKERGGLNHYKISMSGKQIEKHFSTSYSESHLFAIVFAHWWPLTPEQIALIANKKYDVYNQCLLEFFLLGGDLDQAKGILSSKKSAREKNHALHCTINERYLIYKTHESIPAFIGDEYHLLSDDGNLYRMCFYWGENSDL